MTGNMTSLIDDAVSPTTSRYATADINIKPGKHPFSPDSSRRTFFNRAFGKLEKGSLRGSIFSLCASAIGSGVLSLPFVLNLNGWVLGFIFIIVGAIGKAADFKSKYSRLLELVYDHRVGN